MVSRLHQAAVIRCLEVIVEAANKVARDCQNAHPEIEWREIVGMRNRLIHNYGDIRLDVVWNALQGKLPSLIATLTTLVPPADDAELP